MSDNESICSRRSNWADKFDTATGKYVCGDCGKVFDRVDAIRKHCNRDHPVAKEKATLTKVVKDVAMGKWRCPYCPDSPHETPGGLRKHVARRHPTEPRVSLKEATSTEGQATPATGPPKSKVVVPAPKEAGVLAAMTRLAGYDVRPDPVALEEGENSKRARIATMAATAAAVLAGKKRPAKTSADKLVGQKLAKVREVDKVGRAETRRTTRVACH